MGEIKMGENWGRWWREVDTDMWLVLEHYIDRNSIVNNFANHSILIFKKRKKRRDGL